MKFSKVIIIIWSCTLFLNMQCDGDEGNLPISLCDTSVVVDNSAYQNAQSAFYNLINAEINEDCLNVNISASGCSGETWILELIDSEGVMESLPPQRSLKLILTNNEACLAVFNKTQSFDLTQLRVEGDGNEVILNIEGFPEPITYSY